MTHDAARISLGALALGALDDQEAAEVQAHLAQCPECQREYDELSALPALLALVPTAEAIAGPAVATKEAGERLLQQVAAERKAKLRRGYASRFAGALALAAAAAVIGFVVAEAEGPPVEPADFTLANTDEATGVWAEVALTDVGWGTEIELEMSGAEVGENCRLVAVSATEQETASTWVVPPTDAEYITVPGGVGLHPDEIDYFDVLSKDNQLLVRIQL